MKVILKRDEFNELKKEYEVHHIEEDKYGNKKIYLSENRWVSPTLVEKYIEGDNMKTDIYTLLGMIKDGNIPQRIIFKDQIYEYVESAEDYYNEEHGYIFDVYVLKSILNDEVTILETTITYNQDDYIQYQPYTGEVKIKCNSAKSLLESDKIEKLDDFYNDNGFGITIDLQKVKDKINEIIDRINNV